MTGRFSSLPGLPCETVSSVLPWTCFMLFTVVLFLIQVKKKKKTTKKHRRVKKQKQPCIGFTFRPQTKRSKKKEVQQEAKSNRLQHAAATLRTQ